MQEGPSARWQIAQGQLALHEVTPITRGRRYAFLPFLYGEEDAARRLANNSRIAEGSARYTVGDDFLYPEMQANAAE